MNRENSLLSDLIPISAHYDGSTLITKNGELVQIIYVQGFSKRFDKTSQANLRDEVRKVLKELLSQDVMFYLYVKRDYKKLDFPSEFVSEVAHMKHKLWIKENSFEMNLINELYIAIVHIGGKLLFAKKNIIQHIFANKIQNKFSRVLDEAVTAMAQISVSILQKIERFGPKLLSVVEKNNQIISEPLSFLSYLLNANWQDVEVSKADFAKVLTNNITMQNSYNTCKFNVDNSFKVDYEGRLKVSDGTSESHYISILTFKSGYNLPTKYTDHILNLDQRMVITETIKLSTSDKFPKLVNTHKKLYEFTKMEIGLSIVNDILIGIDKPIKSQISIKVIGSSYQDLDIKTSQTKSLLFKIGISFVTEDLYMLGSFFSILPGNSHLLRREFMTTSESSCIFGSIKPKSLGGYNGSIWGNPVTIFKTTDNLPFFFNFHNSKNIGHMIVVGKAENGLHQLISFLISESFRFDLRVIDLFSLDNDLEIIYKSLNVVDSYDVPSVNMMKIIDYKPEDFYKVVMFTIFGNSKIDDELSKQTLDLLKNITEILKEEKDIETFVNEISNIIATKIMNSDIQSKLKEFFSKEIFFKFFYYDSPIEKRFFKTNLSQFSIANQSHVVAIFSFFILKKIVQETNESNLNPIIISLSSDIFSLGIVYKEEIIDILNKLSQRNAVVIFAFEDKSTLCDIGNISEIINNSIGVKIFLSEKFIDKSFKMLFDLSHAEVNKIKMYTPKEKIFLMKQDDHSITFSFKALDKININ